MLIDWRMDKNIEGKTRIFNSETNEEYFDVLWADDNSGELVRIKRDDKGNIETSPAGFVVLQKIYAPLKFLWERTNVN